MTMNAEVKKVIDVLPVMRQFVDKKSYLSVMDDAGIIQGYSTPAGERPLMRVGERLDDPTGAYDEVMRTGKSKVNYLPEEVMGEAFEGVLVPIKDGGQTVGCLIYTHSASTKDQVKNMTTQFKESVTDINDSISQVVSGFENMFENLKIVDEKTTAVEQDVNAATAVVSKINGNASHSNILALNASIEAARSGAAGRGFAVVATEMGKLANDSGSSAKEIDATLSTITQHLEDINNSIHSINQIAERYLGDINEVKVKLEKTLELSSVLESTIRS